MDKFQNIKHNQNKSFTDIFTFSSLAYILFTALGVNKKHFLYIIPYIEAYMLSWNYNTNGDNM